MPTGILINVASVILGGLVGSVVGPSIPESTKQQLNWIFGLCALAMGIISVILLQNLPAVVFSVIIGTLLGFAVKFGKAIEAGTTAVLNKVMPNNDSDKTALMITAIVLFCASGTGIYGSLDSGMTGNHTILIAKAVLDFFTAMIFACQLGKSVSLISIPQIIIMLALFLLAKAIVPLTTPAMIGDFKACGGFLLLATGFRLMQLRMFPVADMIPAMIIIMPVSYFGSTYLLPLI